MISESGRIFRDGESVETLKAAIDAATRQHRCQKALDKLEVAQRHVRRLGYHSLADDVARVRQALRDLIKAEGGG